MPTHRRLVGAVHALNIVSSYVFCIALPEADFVFFDHRSSTPEAPRDLLKLPQLFRVSVHKSAWNKGRWLRVGVLEVPEDLLQPVPRFMRDALKTDQYSIYLNGNVRPASRNECLGLERASVWEPEHVESRLSDHYAGKPNVWVQQLALGEA
jgi:hypothetical protein